MNQNQILGKWGERVASDYFISKGYEVLFRNWRSPYGELDLILKKNNIISIVEVKTRRGIGFGYPEEAVTLAKQEHLMNASLAFFDQTEEYKFYQWQIDVLSVIVTGDPHEPYKIRHFENAVQG